MQQLRFNTMRQLRPPKPTAHDEGVALKIAERIVAEVNLDEFYWTVEEVPQRVDEMVEEIIKKGRPRTVVHRLWKNQPLVSDDGTRGSHPWGWEGIEEHCFAIADKIEAEEVKAAVDHWMKRYLCG